MQTVKPEGKFSVSVSTTGTGEYILLAMLARDCATKVHSLLLSEECDPIDIGECVSDIISQSFCNRSLCACSCSCHIVKRHAGLILGEVFVLAF